MQAGHVVRMGEIRNAYSLVGKPEKKRTPGKPKRRWEQNINMALRKIGGDCVDCMRVVQDRIGG